MKKNLVILSLVLLVFSLNGCRQNMKVVAGGLNEGDEKGMVLFDFEENDLELKFLSPVDAGPNPSWICFSDRHNLIYALNEVRDFSGDSTGGITVLEYDPESWIMEKKDEMPVPYGGPCHFSVTADGNFMLVASYSSSSVAVIRLDKNGMPEKVTDTILYLSEPRRVSHPHMIEQDPAARHIYLTDLGLDRIMVYDLDQVEGKLIPVPGGTIDLPRRSGPRHFVFNSSGSKMYVINELGSSITVFKINDEGLPEPFQSISTVDETYEGRNQCAEIFFGKDEKFLYGSNRGENTIVVFSVGKDGSLTLAGRTSCGGNWPRNFAIDPSGRYLLCGNQRSDNIAVFSIDRETGLPLGPESSVPMKGVEIIRFFN